jgi:hypothetical protein
MRFIYEHKTHPKHIVGLKIFGISILLDDKSYTIDRCRLFS